MQIVETLATLGCSATGCWKYLHSSVLMHGCSFAGGLIISRNTKASLFAHKYCARHRTRPPYIPGTTAAAFVRH